jgi:predicted phosphoadenosine phosphosulfate sulfurtransferase
MSTLKQYAEQDVMTAAQERIRYVFDNLPRIYVSFSGGKDSTVMLHLVMDEAKRRDRKIGVLVIDLEAQYKVTMQHVAEMLETYRANAEVFWVCLPIALRNAVSQYAPRWCCWDPEMREAWVREMPEHPGVISDVEFFPFFVPRMEFEEFDVLFGVWYSQGQDTAAFIGIRCDESLNRFRTIASRSKEMFNGQRYTTKIAENLFNVFYPTLRLANARHLDLPREAPRQTLEPPLRSHAPSRTDAASDADLPALRRRPASRAVAVPPDRAREAGFAWSLE